MPLFLDEHSNRKSLSKKKGGEKKAITKMSSQQPQPQPHHRRRSKRRPSTRTLLPFLRACVGSPVVVELTNDDVMRGTLESVDDGMNLVLSGAGSSEGGGGVRWTRKGTSEPRAVLGGEEASSTSTSSTPIPPFFAPSLHVRGRRIRFVHLPPSIDPATVVDDAGRAAAAARAAYRREMLTKAHGGGGAPTSTSRAKGRGAEEDEEESSFGSGSDGGGDDDDNNNQYYYEDFEEDDDDEDEGEK